MYVEGERIKVIIVEDEPRIMGTIIRKIEKLVPECEIIGTARNGIEALELIKIQRPHIVFTDIKMPGMDGLALSKSIKEKFPGVFIVIISGFSEFSFAQEALRYGVFNYLLKPIVDDKLIETIKEISQEIDQIKTINNRGVMVANQQTDYKLSIDEIFSGGKQLLFLICFNNICYDIEDKVLVDYYTSNLTKIDWELVIRKMGINHNYWMILDEYAVNQKSMIISTRGVEKDNYQGMAELMKLALEEIYPQFKVNICMHKEPISREDMWIYIQRMRNILMKCITIGHSGIYVLESEEEKNRIDVFKIVENRIQNNINYAIQAENKIVLHKEVIVILEYLESHLIGQKQQEKVLFNILKLFEDTLQNYDALKIEEAQVDLLRIMSMSHHFQEVEKAFFICIELYSQRKEKLDPKKDIQLEIHNYVDQNFRIIESVEDVAEVFNYNYTYLSRLFKKITGMSMTKYITQKRINEAKYILESDPEIGIQQVGKMVGYKDQHYFSRIFKLTTGINPSEYKENTNNTKNMEKKY